MPDFTLHRGDCLETMRGMADNSVDSIVTDPPYGLSFMGKKWDCDVPAVEVWAECLRVLKPGGYLLAFAGTRTQHRMAVRIEDAGFEIRDMIAWVYGSGFPKSHNLQGDKQGWGTALKPALEPITVARKPLVGTVAANVLEHGTGALNIDGCRVPTGDKLGGGDTSADVDRTGKHEGWQRPWMADAEAAKAAAERRAASVARSEALGRWPANIIHDGSVEVLARLPESVSRPAKAVLNGGSSGDGHGGLGGWGMKSACTSGYQDVEVSAARFFYCAKASRSDRNEGLDGFEQKRGGAEQFDSRWKEGTGEMRQPTRANIHPTVKPTDLMAYLVRLVTPPGGVVLDPFMGSGSTGKAAMREGFDFIGCELDDGYIEIARARIEQAHAQGQLFEPTQVAPVQLGFDVPNREGQPA